MGAITRNHVTYDRVTIESAAKETGKRLKYGPLASST